MFEKATREKFRFQFHGQCSVEDLWDLSPTDLDSIFKALNRQAKVEQDEESLLDEKTAENETLSAKIGIVRRIVEVKLAEQEAHEQAVLKAARKQKILRLMAEKQDDNLREMSLEDLQKLVDEL